MLASLNMTEPSLVSLLDGLDVTNVLKAQITIFTSNLEFSRLFR